MANKPTDEEPLLSARRKYIPLREYLSDLLYNEMIDQNIPPDALSLESGLCPSTIYSLRSSTLIRLPNLCRLLSAPSVVHVLTPGRVERIINDMLCFSMPDGRIPVYTIIPDAPVPSVSLTPPALCALFRELREAHLGLSKSQVYFEFDCCDRRQIRAIETDCLQVEPYTICALFINYARRLSDLPAARLSDFATYLSHWLFYGKINYRFEFVEWRDI